MDSLRASGAALSARSVEQEAALASQRTYAYCDACDAFEAGDLETAERDFSTCIRMGAGLPEVEGAVRYNRAQCRMRMLLERPGADAAAVEDLTIAIRSPDLEVRFLVLTCRCAAYCSLNDPVSMLRDFTDAGSMLAAHRPLLQPLLPDFERHMTVHTLREQGQHDKVLLLMRIVLFFPREVTITTNQMDIMCTTSCQRMCRAVEAAKTHLAGAKAQAGQPNNASIARAKERGGNSYRQRDYAAALEAYSQAIEAAKAAASSQEAADGCASNASPSARAILYSNRAATHIQLGAWEAAVQDCSSALALDPCCVKASLRRVHATLQLHESLGLAGSLRGGAQPGRRDWHHDLMRCFSDLSAVTSAGEEDAGPTEECQRLVRRVLVLTQCIAQQHLPHGAAHPPSSPPDAAPAPGHAGGGAEAGVQPASSAGASMYGEAAAGAAEAADSVGQQALITAGLQQLCSMCAHCGKPDCALPGRKLKVCMRCRVEAYCSEACQRAHWPHHKAACKRIADGRAQCAEL